MAKVTVKHVIICCCKFFVHLILQLLFHLFTDLSDNRRNDQKCVHVRVWCEEMINKHEQSREGKMSQKCMDGLRFNRLNAQKSKMKKDREVDLMII